MYNKEASKKYYQKNKEKYQLYYLENKERITANIKKRPEYSKKYYHNNKDKFRQASRKYYYKNKNQVNQNAKNYYQNNKDNINNYNKDCYYYKKAPKEIQDLIGFDNIKKDRKEKAKALKTTLKTVLNEEKPLIEFIKGKKTILFE